MIVFFSILNSTTNCDMVCRNDEHCRVWAKLEVVCVGPGDIAVCLFQNSKPTSGKFCIKEHFHNRGGDSYREGGNDDDGGYDYAPAA
ncbi:hypothetical protein P8452_54985 [Trifolium repens]|nr:hypothetical protein P8452_54985 [Trifolium repens]